MTNDNTFPQQVESQTPLPKSVDGEKKTSRNKAKPDISLNDLPDLLTVREVADIFRVSPLTIKRWGKRGILPFIRINSRGDRRYKKETVLWKLGITPKQ